MVTVLIAVGVLLAHTDLPASAGAPNYECESGPYRIGIDQHRRGGLVRVGRGPVHAMPFVGVADQSGESLGLTVQLPLGEGRIRVAGYGATMTLNVNGQTYHGACAFVPGNFVLGHVTARSTNLNVDPTKTSTVIASPRFGSLMWSSGRFDEAANELRGSADWSQFRVVLAIRGGATEGGSQLPGMGQAAGLDGRSEVVNGWGQVATVTLLPNPR
jgi:hypothetical protein